MSTIIDVNKTGGIFFSFEKYVELIELLSKDIATVLIWTLEEEDWGS